METQEAYNQYLVTANDNASYQSTILWILFTVFIIAPIIMGIIIVFVGFASRRKCPNCGSYKNTNGIQVTSKDGVATSKTVTICSGCSNEF